jgi:hypothetical protein
MKIEPFRQLFKKSSNVKFNENPSSWNRVVPCGQADGGTDRYDEAVSRHEKLKCHYINEDKMGRHGV